MCPPKWVVYWKLKMVQYYVNIIMEMLWRIALDFYNPLMQPIQLSETDNTNNLKDYESSDAAFLFT